MNKYEVKIKVLTKEDADRLILLLVHQGYAVYFNDECDEIAVCFESTSEDVTEIPTV